MLFSKKTEYQKLAKTYFEQAQSDFRFAKSAFQKNELSKAALLFNQAAINSLTSICITNQKHQNPTYNLSELLLVASAFEKELESLQATCEKLDGIQEKSLFQLHKQRSNFVTLEEVVTYEKGATQVIQTCKNLIKTKKLF